MATDSGFVEMSEDQWERQFRPLTDPDGSIRQFDSHLHGAEVVAARNAGTLWTVTDDDGDLHLTSGYHWVNRLYHYITEVPVSGPDVLVTDF